MKVKMISKPNQKLVHVDPEFDTEGIDEEDWECIYCEDFFSTGDTDDYTAMSIFDYDYDSGIVKFEFEGSDHELLELGDDPDGSTEVWDVYKRIELFTEEFNIEWAICLFIDDSGEMVTSIDSDDGQAEDENDDGQTEEIRNGLYESFHENGQLHLRENYKDGELDGLFEVFHENGQLSLRGNHKDGKMDGLVEEFHESGQLNWRGNYKDGEREGLYEEFRENGQLQLRGTFKDGKMDGLWEGFNENGQLEEKENYKDGKKDGLRELFQENGQSKAKENYKDGVLQDPGDAQTEDTGTEVTETAPKDENAPVTAEPAEEVTVTLSKNHKTFKTESGDYRLERYKDGKIKAFKDDELCKNTKNVLRAINKEYKLEFTSGDFKKLHTRKLGKEIIEKMKTVQEKDKKLDFEAIQDEDGDWLTHILGEYDELYDEIILLNITKEDLLNKNDSNINQVGYKAPYGDNDEIEGLVYYYFKKCVEWYGNERDPGGLSLEASAKKEALLIIEDEKKYPEHTFLVLLYCEGTYLWSLGG